MSRPKTELLTFFILFYSGFLIPILISSAICLHLIYKKKRLFHNEVSFIQQPKNQPHCPNFLTLPISVYEQQLEMEAKKKEEENRMHQISAAEHSLKTNGFVGLFFAILFCTIMVVSKEARIFFNFIMFAIFKAALPLMTSIANFGTIQYVAKQYWSYFKSHSCFA